MRYFVAVAEELNFSRAARRLHISQPSLSNRIKDLEKELGVALFERTGRGVRLTEAGELLLEEARSIFAQVEGTVRMVRRVGHGEVGRLGLGFVPSANNEVLPPILQAFTGRFPDVELSLIQMRPDRIVQRLHDKQIDAGLLYLPLDDPSLAVRRVSREPLVLALAETHPLASEPETVDLGVVAEEPFILPGRYQMPGLYDQVLEACRQAGFDPKAVQKDVWGMPTTLGLVAGGIGVALLPASARNVSWKGVVYKTVRELAPTVEMGVVWHRDEGGPVLRAFLEVVNGIGRDGKADGGPGGQGGRPGA